MVMIRYNVIACIISYAILCGCGNSDGCDNFPDKLEAPIRKTNLLPDADPNDPSIVFAQKIIDTCYVKSSFYTPGYRTINRKVKKYGDKGFIITFGFHGISDNNIGFIVRKNGVIDKAFEFSSL